jgi:large subunit ribosomal protein L29
MLINELREKSNTELLKEIDTLKEELFTLRFQAATGQLTNTAQIKVVRKTIAKIKTVLNERARNEQQEVTG